MGSMKRLVVLVCAAAAVALALRHPAPPAAIASVPAPQASQRLRKGHPPSRVSSATVVYVVGAVAHAGLYTLPAGARVSDAVRRAGGFRSDADVSTVNLAQLLSDGEEIHVLRIGETPLAGVRRTSRKARARKARAAPSTRLDLNRTDAAALSSLPGIGPTLAERIVQFRRLNGPFDSLDELADVAGMTQRRIDALALYVTVNTGP